MLAGRCLFDTLWGGFSQLWDTVTSGQTQLLWLTTVGHIVWGCAHNKAVLTVGLLKFLGWKDEERETCMGIVKAFDFQSPLPGLVDPLLRDFL